MLLRDLVVAKRGEEAFKKQANKHQQISINIIEIQLLKLQQTNAITPRKKTPQASIKAQSRYLFSCSLLIQWFSVEFSRQQQDTFTFKLHGCRRSH